MLFIQYYERLVLFAESYVADLSTAEDIVQDVFLLLLSHAEFKKVEYDRSYLYSCVKNSCIDHLRKLKIKDAKDYQLVDATFYSGYFEEAERENVIRQLEEAVQKLPEQRRQILMLSIYQKMSYAEIATYTGLSVNTVKTHIKMAYRDLRERLSHFSNSLILSLLVSLRQKIF